VFSPQRWYLRRRPAPGFERQLPQLEPVLAKVLYARHIDTADRARAFLAADGELANPFDLADMGQAVGRLRRAIASKEHLVVYGDFDVDGISATTLLVSALRDLGADVRPYIPDRFAESYGLNTDALGRLYEEGARLVITVDCGIRSRDEIAYAQGLGLDIIVTDHHTVPDALPPAVAIVNPKRPDCRYPFKDLSGVGVAFRLADALFRVSERMGGANPAVHDASRFLDLVALGTIADIVPLTGENRLLAQWGLQRLRTSPRPGLLALMEASHTPPGAVDSQAIGFRLGPRLNAAGRLEHGELAYQLLMSGSPDDARQLAEQLDSMNAQRQQLLEEQLAQARGGLGAGDDRRLLFVDGPDFHEGIVGLIASRLCDEFYRPALVMRRGEERTRGSARSIEGFHITKALQACADLLIRFGGHAQAAGFTLASKDIEALRQRLEAYCREHLPDTLLERRVDVDAIISLDELTEETPVGLGLLEPCGEGNPQASLASLAVRIRETRAVGQEGKHLRLLVDAGDDDSVASTRALTAIAFRQGELAEALSPGDRVDLVYSPSLNNWQGETRLELVVHALRPSSRVHAGASNSAEG